jgi:hypothetical protein
MAKSHSTAASRLPLLSISASTALSRSKPIASSCAICARAVAHSRRHVSSASRHTHVAPTARSLKPARERSCAPHAHGTGGAPYRIIDNMAVSQPPGTAWWSSREELQGWEGGVRCRRRRRPAPPPSPPPPPPPWAPPTPPPSCPCLASAPRPRPPHRRAASGPWLDPRLLQRCKSCES